MNIEEIVKLAQQVQDEGFAPVGIWPEVRRLCELAYAAGQAAEREACAKVCDEQQSLVGAEMCCVAMNCAAAIRARGNT